MKLHELMCKIKVCTNPLYPSFSDQVKFQWAKRSFKGVKRRNWYLRYGQWMEDSDTLASLGE